MDADIDVEDIDRDILYDRIEELEAECELGMEYESLCWARDMLYFIDEGFLISSADNRYFWNDDLRCPENL